MVSGFVSIRRPARDQVLSVLCSTGRGSGLTPRVVGSPWLLAGNSGTFKEYFDVPREEKPLGKGGFGIVYRCRAKKGGDEETYAVKCILKKRMTPQQHQDVFREVHAGFALQDCEDVVLLKAAFDEPGVYYLVMELLAGGELFDHIIEQGNITEHIVAHVGCSMLMGSTLGIVLADADPCAFSPSLRSQCGG